MGQPRPSRRKVIAVSSDEDEEPTGLDIGLEQSDDDQPVKPQTRSTGKLKSVKKSSRAQQPTPVSSTQNGSQKSPAKPKVTKTKSKTAVRDPPKPSVKPIYSFFNATTQKLQNSQPSASPEKLPTTQEEPEAIHDDTDDGDGSSLQLSKGSSTALALRKRKVQDGNSFETDSSLPPQASQKFRKAANGDRVPSFSVRNEDKRPWTEQFQPQDLTELAVHKRKVGDVRQWLEMTLSGRHHKVLVLKGAAGTGKTTTMRLLAKELGVEITEWKNPAGGEFVAEGSISAALQFGEFVGRAGRSGGLEFAQDGNEHPYANDRKETIANNSAARGQILLIEEFPNTFSRSSSTLQSFRSAIMQYLSMPASRGSKPTPLVMIVSETLLSTNTALADSFTAHRLLGPELSNHSYLDTIEFNAVAHTYLIKALETVILKEARKSGRRKTPGPQVLKRLAESGDMRSAISSLEFLCLRGDDGDIWSSKVTFTKQKKSKSDAPLTQFEEDALKLISNRESTLGIFHAVGKVVYNKRIEAQSIPHPPPWFPQHRRNKVPENNVDELIDELGTDTSTFIAALHENYALSCSSSSQEETLDSLAGCINNISDADLLSVDRFSYGTRAFSGSATDSLRQDEMAFQIGVRGLWFNLPYPVHRSSLTGMNKRDGHQMFYPASLKLWRGREELEGLLNILTNKLQSGELLSNSNVRSEDTGTTVYGVESWKRNNTRQSESSDGRGDDPLVERAGSAKMEMLLERLPYVAKIISSKKVPSKVIEQLHMVTHIRTSRTDTDEDDAELDEGRQADHEQWATDRPDTESGRKSRTVQTKPKQGQAKLTEGGGLGIPVESRVEKLVLEDDDIVDD